MDHIVTKVARLSLNNRHYLVCGGDFNGVLIFKEGDKLETIPTTDWSTSISVRDDRILVGTTDEVLLYRVGIENNEMAED
jgi:hypothetical protein